MQRGEPMLRRSVIHDGVEREYFVYIPKGYSKSEAALPVLVAVHGHTSTATGFQAAHGLNRHADQQSYLLVYPQGSHFLAEDEQGRTSRITSWNDLAANQPELTAGPHCTAERNQYPCPPECGECTHCGWTSCYDDVGFIEKLLDSVQFEFVTDRQRVYLLGVSNGGMTALRLGCNLSNRFAAIAPIIGQLAPGYACGPDTDVPMLHLFGGQDDTVRIDGKPATDGFIYTTAAETAAVWASAMRCKSGPENWTNEIALTAGFECMAYSDCRVANHEVVSCLDPDGVHVWPRQGFEGASATCVTSEQFRSMPGQSHCEQPPGAYVHTGMDLVWAFMRRYRRGLGE